MCGSMSTKLWHFVHNLIVQTTLVFIISTIVSPPMTLNHCIISPVIQSLLESWRSSCLTSIGKESSPRLFISSTVRYLYGCSLSRVSSPEHNNRKDQYPWLVVCCLNKIKFLTYTCDLNPPFKSYMSYILK